MKCMGADHAVLCLSAQVEIWGKVAVGFVEKFLADGFENIGLNIHLGDGRDNLMAYIFMLVIALAGSLVLSRQTLESPRICSWEEYDTSRYEQRQKLHA
jgi:hypothetical protein